MFLRPAVSLVLPFVAFLLSFSTAKPLQPVNQDVGVFPHPRSDDSWKSWSAPTFYKGHDLSSVQLLNEYGYIYKDTARDNETRPVEDILGDGGMNGVRLRYDEINTTSSNLTWSQFCFSLFPSLSLFLSILKHPLT